MVKKGIPLYLLILDENFQYIMKEFQLMRGIVAILTSKVHLAKGKSRAIFLPGLPLVPNL